MIATLFAIFWLFGVPLVFIWYFESVNIAATAYLFFLAIFLGGWLALDAIF